MIKRISTTAVYVEDQAKAKSFWTEKVGFQVVNEQQMTPQFTWLEVGPEGAESRLVLYPKSMMDDAENKKASIVFECENIEQLVESMKEKGITFSMEPKKMPFGTFASFKDEDGNEFGLKE